MPETDAKAVGWEIFHSDEFGNYYSSDADEIGVGTKVLRNPFDGKVVFDSYFDDDTSYLSRERVAFGKYNGKHILYNVLDTASNDFGVQGGSVLLDSYNTLEAMSFGKNNDWSKSTVKSWLNDTFLQNCYTAVEQAAIAASRKNAMAGGDVSSADKLDSEGNHAAAFAPLNGEKVFILDSSEARRDSYGFRSHYLAMKRDINTGKYTGYWLRSPITKYNKNSAVGKGYAVGCNSEGYNIHAFSVSDKVAVSPALNIKKSSILFTIAHMDNWYSYICHFTLLDDDLKIGITNGEAVSYKRGRLTIPYSITGPNAKNATHLSLLILDKEYTPGNTNDAEIVSYERIKIDAVTGSVEAIIHDFWPGCKAYIIAEDIHDIDDPYDTNYASAPLEVSIPVAYVTKAPKAKEGLLSDGSLKELVEAGTANTSIEYALGTSAKVTPEFGWSETAPKGTCGTFYVWYRAKGTDLFETGPSKCIKVVLEYKRDGFVRLGTGDINNPVYVPENPKVTNGKELGTFNYVYYGNYDGTPIRFRVLDKSSRDFGVDGGSLFLDCDYCLYETKFDEDGASPGGTKVNDWDISDVKRGLNGNQFLNKPGVFTENEKNAIAYSTKTAKLDADGGYGTSTACTFKPINNERIFLLDIYETFRFSYGYKTQKGTDGSATPARVKTDINGNAHMWMLRTPHAYIDTCALGESGNVYYMPVTDLIWISPCFNVKRSSILFSALVNGTAGSSGAEYKLTLIDDSLSASISKKGKITREGNVVTVPYSVSGSPDRLSVMITDKDYTDSSATLKYYSGLNISGELGKTGKGTFTLPEKLGAGYKVYLVAEKINSGYATDYASKPVELTIPGFTVSFDANEGTTLTESETTQLNNKLEKLPKAEREGYYFMGWYTDKEGGDEVSVKTVILEDQTVYAHWNIIKTITLDANGGELSEVSIVTNKNNTVDTIPAPVCEGYNFEGWFTDPIEGSAVNTSTKFEEDQTIYAHWQKATTVKFDAQGGKVSPEYSLTELDKKLKTYPRPEREGYYFTGWYTGKTKGELVDNDRTYEEDSTIYAHWINKIYYIGADGREQTCDNVSILSKDMTSWSDGWYTASTDLKFDEGKDARIIINGTVNLILMDDIIITVPSGIQVPEGATLNIYRQKFGSGKLIATTVNTSGTYSAAIGGGNEYGGSGTFGTINVYGGTIETNAKGHGAGIGGGYKGTGGVINIYGGSINAYGYRGAGIGGGSFCSSGNVYIYGGNVSSESSLGAGIGGGYAGDAGNINISGGIVSAVSDKYGAGIGGGGKEKSDKAKKTPGDGGNIAILGGKVTASSKNGLSIGPGKNDKGSKMGTLGTLILDGTDEDDFIDAKTIKVKSCTLKKMFIFYSNGKSKGRVNESSIKSKDNKKIIKPVIDSDARISIDGGDINVYKKQKNVILTVTVGNPGEGKGKTKWSSSNTKIVSINSKGKLNIKKMGEVTITAKYTSDSTEGVASITVRVYNKAEDIPKEIENLTASAQYSDIAVGGASQIEVTITPEDAAADILFETENPDVAEIDRNGLVTGKGVGITRIIVKAGDKESYVTINVYNPVTPTPTPTPDPTSTPTPDPTVTPTPDPTSTPTPDPTLTPTPDPTLTPTPDPTLTPTPDPTVTPTPDPTETPAVESVLASIDRNTIMLGETAQVTVEISPSDIEASIVYVSKNEEVANVDETGKVYGLSSGTAVISVEADGKTAEVSVEVKDYTYKEPVYTWAENGHSVEAVAVCNEDTAKNISESATLENGKVVRTSYTAPTTDNDGSEVYTANFEKDIFEQSKYTVVLERPQKPQFEALEKKVYVYETGDNAEPITVTASATDDGELSYQWYYVAEGVSIPLNELAELLDIPPYKLAELLDIPVEELTEEPVEEQGEEEDQENDEALIDRGEKIEGANSATFTPFTVDDDKYNIEGRMVGYYVVATNTKNGVSVSTESELIIVWVRYKMVKVTFDATVGTVFDEVQNCRAQTVTYDVVVGNDLWAPLPLDDNMSSDNFLGWALSENGDVVIVRDGHIWSVTEGATYYAIWGDPVE
ncbi:MAG: InlB B-repeat-containing protein [Lachnospiraceae bacterium]|nr:InlB B-repeat-containing protein [Lachnospiraceae bacterium]